MKKEKMRALLAVLVLIVSMIGITSLARATNSCDVLPFVPKASDPKLAQPKPGTCVVSFLTSSDGSVPPPAQLNNQCVDWQSWIKVCLQKPNGVCKPIRRFLAGNVPWQIVFGQEPSLEIGPIVRSLDPKVPLTLCGAQWIYARPVESDPGACDARGKNCPSLAAAGCTGFILEGGYIEVDGPSCNCQPDALVWQPMQAPAAGSPNSFLTDIIVEGCGCTRGDSTLTVTSPTGPDQKIGVPASYHEKVRFGIGPLGMVNTDTRPRYVYAEGTLNCGDGPRPFSTKASQWAVTAYQ